MQASRNATLYGLTRTKRHRTHWSRESEVGTCTPNPSSSFESPDLRLDLKVRKILRPKRKLHVRVFVLRWDLVFKVEG